MPEQQPFTVLCVDDDVDGRESTALLLRAEGYRVLEAGGGAEALRRAGEADVILLDVRLPDLDGFEVCRRLRADPATALVPVLLLSGLFTRGEDKAQGLEGGADAYLTKPVEPPVLRAHVRALLRVRQAEVRALEAARQAEEGRQRLELALEAGRLGTWERDFATNALRASAQCKAHYGVAGDDEFTYERFVRAVHPDDRDRVREAVRRAAERHTDYQAEYRCVWPDGSTHWVAARGRVVYGPGDRASRLVGFTQDVTERRLLEEQLRQAQKMEAVGRLAGGVAHDFNNLLTVINGYGEIVAGSLPAGHPARELVGHIRDAGERAASLTRQLLAFSRKTVLEPRVLDLNARVREMERLLRRLIGEDIDLATRLDPGLGRVKVDPDQLEHAVINLAVNARDAMPRGGRLTVETRNVELDEGYARSHPDVRPGPYALLAVSDTGHGMDEATRARIFEPFFTTKGPGRGTGLGLAMVYGFVKQSGGHVAVYSEPGRGATFKLYLPRALEAEAPRKSSPGLLPLPRGTETVLLVEDEGGVRALTGHLLRSCGYAVLEAADGKEALRVAEDHAGRIELLVTDVVMPGGMGGRLVAEAVRARHPEARVLFVSGYTDDAVVRHGVLEADVNFLQKPYTPTALARKVREVLDQQR